MLIVAVASVQGLLTLSVMKNLAGELKLRYSAFTVILLFGVLVLCDYRYPYYASIRLLLAFVFTWGFFATNHRWTKLSALIWPLMATLLFYLASGSALFVFTLATTLIFVATNKERIWLFAIPFFIILAGLIPYIGYKFLFQMTFRNIYGITVVKPPEQLTYTQGYPIYIYYALLPVKPSRLDSTTTPRFCRKAAIDPQAALSPWRMILSENRFPPSDQVRGQAFLNMC